MGSTAVALAYYIDNDFHYHLNIFRTVEFMLNIILGLLLLSIVTIPTFGQSQKVVGKVLDQSGSPVAGASLIVKSPDGRERIVQSDGQGRFEIDARPGENRLEVFVQGFERASIDISSASSELSITLAPQPISESVTVTAARTQISADDSTVPVSVVSRESIEQRAVNTVGDLFRSLPGTSTNNEGAFQVRPRIRGLESNRVLVLVDGERLNNARTATGQSGIEPGLVDLSQIETVEIVRGSGSVLYGTDALAGTINIISRDTPTRRDDAFRFGGSLSTNYSSNENGRSGNLSLNGSGRHFAFRISQSLERFENYFTGKADGQVPADILAIGGISTDGEVQNSQSHGGNTQLTARLFVSDNVVGKMNFERRRAADIGSPTLVGTFNGFFPFSNRDKLSGRVDAVQVTGTLQRISLGFYYQDQRRNFTNILTVAPVPPFFPGQYQFSDTNTNTDSSGLDLQTDWNLGSRNRLITGVSLFRDFNTDRRLLITATTPTATTRTTRTSRSVPDASLTNTAAFAQNEFRVTNRFRIVGGLRVDRFSTNARQTSDFTLDPRFTASQIEDLGLQDLTSGLNVTNSAITGDIGGVLDLTQTLSASARIGRSFRTPNIFERFFTDFGSVSGFVVGNPKLVPESGINFDSTLRYRRSNLAGSVTYFRNRFENFLATPVALNRNGLPITIPRPPQAPIQVFQTQNVRSALIQGFEAELEGSIKIALGYLTPYGNFSYLRGDNLTEDLPLDSISPVRTNLGFRWQNFLRSYFVDYNVRIAERQDRVPPTALLPVTQGGNGGPEPGYVVHNLNGGYYLRRERFNFNVNLGVSNLLNRAFNEQFVFAPARGRSFTIGTKIEFK